MIIKYCTVCLLITFIYSCVPAPVGVDTAGIDAKNKTIAILPFGLEKDNEALQVPEGYLQRFNHSMHESLFNSLHSTLVIDLNKSYEILRNTESYDNSFAEFSAQSGADYILTGFVSHYKQRVGGDLGVESPAAVSFLTRLYDAKTGALLWQYFYTEQQSPLFENIAEVGKFFKRKGKWVTVWELTEEGIIITANKIKELLEANANNTGDRP
ncbi:MAG TPA: hypothetical protein VLB82_12835 [Thermodesulfobacteriota bacterium]|nr:hypothetical protein [Thermodesulfobacteriota bacterium]